MQPLTKDEVLIRAADHHLTFMAIAFGHLRNWTAAEDAVQEAYLTMGEKWRDYRPESSIVRWGRAIVRFKCMDYWKANKRTSSFSNEYIEKNMHSELDQFFDQESSVEMEDKIRALSICMNSLNEHSQKLLYQFYVEGRRCRDIAQEDGKKEKTYSMHLWRLRSKLRKCMKSTNASAEEEPSENEEIIDEFFIASDGDNERICNLLKSEKEAGRPVFVSYIQEWCIFATTLTQIVDENLTLDSSKMGSQTALKETGKMEVIPVQANPRQPRKAFTLSGLAACFLLISALWYSILFPKTNNRLAIVETGSATITSNGVQKEISADDGHTVLSGDSVSVAAGKTCQIKFIGEESTFTITGPSDLEFLSSGTRDGKKVRLIKGSMWADVAKQKSGQALEIETSSSLIKVIGTRFKLSTTELQTTVFLESGRLLVSRKNGEEKKLMTSGQHADIDDSGIYLASDYTSINENGLIVEYKFDEGAGSAFLDSSIYANHGKINKSLRSENAWIVGPVGKAVHFGNMTQNEKSPRFQLQDFSNLTLDHELSIVCWLYSEATSDPRPETQSILSCQGGGSGFSISIGDHEGWYDLRFSSYNQGVHEYLVTKSKMYHDKWYHVAFTFNRGTVNFYLNGVLNASRHFNHDSISVEPKRALGIGPVLPPFDMAMDNLSIYSRALSNAEISRNARSSQ